MQQTFICSSNRSCHADSQELNKPQTTVLRTSLTATATTHHRGWQTLVLLQNARQDYWW
jgi:hypothetical protein